MPNTLSLIFIILLMTDKFHANLYDIKPIDFIQNGWIELNDLNILRNKSYSRYSVKCNTGFGLNSKSDLVRKHVNLDKYLNSNKKYNSINQLTNWIPIDGLIYKNLPLCYKKCQYQSFILNGNVKLNSKLKNIKNLTNHLVELTQGDSIRFECFNGYYIQKIQSDQVVLTKSKYQFKLIKCEEAINESNESDSEESSESIDMEYYECFKYCQAPKFNSSLTNGFLAPIKNYYKPGDQLRYYCNDGYATEISFFEFDNETKILSNKHYFECSINGTWQIIMSIRQNLSKALSIKNVEYFPLCESLDNFLKKNVNNQSSNWLLEDDFSLNYNELNHKSVTLVFSIVAFLIVFLSFSLLIIRIYHTRNNNNNNINNNAINVDYVNLNGTTTRSESLNNRSSIFVSSNESQSFNSIIGTNSQLFRSLNFGFLSRSNDILRSAPRDQVQIESNSLGMPPSYDQLFSNEQNNVTINEAENDTRRPIIEFNLESSLLSRPNLNYNPSTSNRRSNRTESARRIKNNLTSMRKYKLDKRARRIANPSIQGECSSFTNQ